MDATSNDQPESPPLSIRYFLYWTAGVAITLWLKFGDEPPHPKNVAGVLLVSSSVAYCSAAGGAISLLVWSLCRRCAGRKIPLHSPGAKYGLLTGVTMTLWLLQSFGENRLAEYAESNPDAWFQWWSTSRLVHDCLTVAINLVGVIWIGGILWRTAVLASVLLNGFGAYDSLVLLDLAPSYSSFPINILEAVEWVRFDTHFVPIVAVLLSLIGEWRAGTQRDWLHYFGVLLCAILAVEFILCQLAIAIL